MGIRLKETKQEWLIKTIGRAWHSACTVANETNMNIQVNFTPKQWRVTITAYGQKFIGTGKNEEAMINAFEKFAKYTLAIIDYQEKNKKDE